MSSKMQEIRENARRADELAKQLASEGNLLPKDGVKTSLFTNMVPESLTPSEPAAEPKAQEIVPEPFKEVEAPQSSATENLSQQEEEEKLISEKQYKSAVKAMNEAQRKAAEAEKLLREQAEQNERFQAELQQIKHKLQSGQEVSEEDSFSIDEILAPYSEDLPDTTEVVRRATKAIHDKMNESFNRKLMTVEQQIQRQKEEAEKIKFIEKIRQRDEAVRQKHPDYDDIRMSDEFKTWIYGEAPSLYRAAYEGTVDFTDRDADKIISDYKVFSSPQKSVPNRPKVGSAEVGIKTPSSVVPEMGISNEPDFTAEDMEKLPYMIHRVKDPAQRKALMEKADRYLQSISK